MLIIKLIFYYQARQERVIFFFLQERVIFFFL